MLYLTYKDLKDTTFDFANPITGDSIGKGSRLLASKGRPIPRPFNRGLSHSLARFAILRRFRTPSRLQTQSLQGRLDRRRDLPMPISRPPASTHLGQAGHWSAGCSRAGRRWSARLGTSLRCGNDRGNDVPHQATSVRRALYRRMGGPKCPRFSGTTTPSWCGTRRRQGRHGYGREVRIPIFPDKLSFCQSFGCRKLHVQIRRLASWCPRQLSALGRHYRCSRVRRRDYQSHSRWSLCLEGPTKTYTYSIARLDDPFGPMNSAEKYQWRLLSESNDMTYEKKQNKTRQHVNCIFCRWWTVKNYLMKVGLYHSDL